MSQTNRLINILDKERIEAFNSYNLTTKDIEFIREVNEDVLRKIPQKAFNCAQLSALLGAVIYDHSDIPVAVISGHLDYFEKRIFNCKSPIPYSSEKKEINEIWDGHCWVEIPNLIIDNSIFRTIYLGNVSSTFRDQIIKKFGNGKGTIIAPIEKMYTIGFNYTPCYELNQNQINGLIKSI
ncbi:hypothetical protein [Maribellus maritimus]|uniref:hypothetical protein n=1 Tax=Maribellus maritimus TaxID=2870838 RepID=UPI001EEC2E4C|nr:hypothetical protein [Maribellus maritimus]MCG6191485.1 hypothetical protein [Maribellus maritimus]